MKTENFYCVLCRTEHPHDDVNGAGNCIQADGWYDQAIESDAMETSGAWLAWAREQQFNAAPHYHKVIHKCGHSAYEANPDLKMEFCFDCLGRRETERDEY